MTINRSTFKVIALYGATGVNTLIGLLTSILNTRILGSSGFGDLKFIETVFRFIGSIITVGYFLSITRLLAITKDLIEQRKFIGISVKILILMGGVGSLLAIIFSFIEPIFFNPELVEYFQYYFLIIFAILAYLALLELLKGLGNIYTLSIFTFLPGALYLGTAYLLDYYGLMNLSLVLIILYGLQLLICIIVLYNLKPDFSKDSDILLKLKLENRINGRPIYFGSLAGVATNHIAGFSISYYLNNTQLGFYMLALTLCTPLLTIPSVLGTTFFRHFANSKKISIKIIFFTLIISVPVLLLFYLLIDEIIIYFYSIEFIRSAEIAKFIIISFIFHGLGDLLNRFLGAHGQGKFLRNAAYFVGVVNVLGYSILAKFWGMDGVIFTKIFSSFTYFLLMVYFYKLYKKTICNVQQ